MSLVRSLAVLAMAVGVMAVGHAADATAPELAAALQRKYDGVRDFSADFSHTYQGGVLRKQNEGKRRLEGRAKEALEANRPAIEAWEAFCDEMGLDRLRSRPHRWLAEQA